MHKGKTHIGNVQKAGNDIHFRLFYAFIARFLSRENRRLFYFFSAKTHSRWIG